MAPAVVATRAISPPSVIPWGGAVIVIPEPAGQAATLRCSACINPIPLQPSSVSCEEHIDPMVRMLWLNWMAHLW